VYAVKKPKILDRRAREFFEVHMGVPSMRGIPSELAQGLIPWTAQQIAAIVSSPQLVPSGCCGHSKAKAVLYSIRYVHHLVDEYLPLCWGQ
jgi:hypothetical protein